MSKILELGREVIVAAEPTGRTKVRLGVGTQLVIGAVNEHPQMFMCQADPKWPAFWLYRNSADKIYEAELAERKIVLVTK